MLVTFGCMSACCMPYAHEHTFNALTFLTTFSLCGIRSGGEKGWPVVVTLNLKHIAYIYLSKSTHLWLYSPKIKRSNAIYMFHKANCFNPDHLFQFNSTLHSCSSVWNNIIIQTHVRSHIERFNQLVKISLRWILL